MGQAKRCLLLAAGRAIPGDRSIILVDRTPIDADELSRERALDAPRAVLPAGVDGRALVAADLLSRERTDDLAGAIGAIRSGTCETESACGRERESGQADE